MDKLYRNVKTGETKPLPIKVYQAVKKHWRPVEEPPVTLTEKAVETKVSPIKIDRDIEVVTSGSSEFVHAGVLGTDTEVTFGDLAKLKGDELTPSTKEELQADFEKISGEKPDKRWSEKKLIQKIEELKETK
jgi:hypothetical protein